MKKNFTAFIEANQLFLRDEQILVAVSGGVDSMVLCDLLESADYNFAVAHCNFQLRVEDSDADEAFVKNYCKTHLIKCFTKKFDTLVIAETSKKSIQEIARDLRYDWFSEILQENRNLRYIATAHHASDNVETILYRLAKGTGLKGLTGIAVKDERRVVRPLLFAFKEEILDYAQKNKIAYRQDISNESDKYRRNYIRHHIVPEFEKINPAFEKTAAHSIDVFKDIFFFYKEIVSNFRREFFQLKNDQTVIDWEKLSASHHKNLLLYEFLSPFNFNHEQVLQIIATLEKENDTGKKFFSDTHELLLNRKEIIIREKNFLKKNFEKKIEKNFSEKISEKNSLKNFFEINFEKKLSGKNKKIKFAGKKIELKKDNSNSNYINYIFSEEKSIEGFDADTLKFPLFIRSPKIGDKFQPFGMNGSSKLLSDYFQSLKLSEFEKEEQMLLTDADDNIIWAIGLRMDERFKITEKTKTIWKFTVGDW